MQRFRLPTDTSALLDSQPDARLWSELWVSLASLLRSYTAAHGLNGKEQAMVELGEEHIVVRAGLRSLRLDRSESEVIWAREDGSRGKMNLTVAGRLQTEDGLEEELDMQAESWARELMQ
jgi:hypothetical protein